MPEKLGRPPKYPQEIQQRIIELAAANPDMLVLDIAAAAGVSLQNARYILNINGVKRNRGTPCRFNPADYADIDWTQSLAEIAERRGVSRQRIHQIKQRMENGKC